MVNASLNLAYIVAILGIFSSILAYSTKVRFRRCTGNAFFDLVSALFCPLLALFACFVIFFQGWRLDPILQWAYALIMLCWSYESIYSSNLDSIDSYGFMINSVASIGRNSAFNNSRDRIHSSHTSEASGEQFDDEYFVDEQFCANQKIERDPQRRVASDSQATNSTAHLSEGADKSLKMLLRDCKELYNDGHIDVDEYMDIKKRTLAKFF